MKKTVLVGGCSHSNSYYVKRNETWHSLLKEKYDCDIISHTYNGAGNLFIIDHLMWELNNIDGKINKRNKVDLVIFQVTEQFRTVLGINHQSLLNGPPDQYFGGASCKSINIFLNSVFWRKYSSSKYKFNPDRHDFDDRKNIFLEDFPTVKNDIVYDPEYYEMFDIFYLEQILPSVYETQVRYLRELYLLQSECILRKIPILFIEWWKPLLKMDVKAVEFYYNKLDRNKFVEFDYDKNWDVLKVDGVEQYFGPDGCHFNVKGHKMFFEKYVEPNLPIELDAQI